MFRTEGGIAPQFTMTRFGAPWSLVLLMAAWSLGALWLQRSGWRDRPVHWALYCVLQTLLPTDVLLLGEKHDAPQHQQLERQAVAWLAERGLLAALVIEMAEQGHDTRALASGADEAQVQTALAWDTNAWPWSAYGGW